MVDVRDHEASFARAVERHRGRTGVHLLGPETVYGTFEAALVFSLPPAEEDQVEALRAVLSPRLAAPEDLALAPHVTLVFVGRWPAERLRTFIGAVPASAGRVRVRWSRLGTFIRARRVVNVHIDIDRDGALHALHDRVCARLASEGWFPQTPYVGPRYHPHVSIVDGIDVDAETAAGAIPGGVPPVDVELRHLYWIGKSVDARRRGES